MDVYRASRKGLGRKHVKRRTDKRVFTKTALRSRKENVISNPMRGGIRL